MATTTDLLTLPPDATFHKVGEVDVESGQVLLIDPCYIDAQWKNEPYANRRIYRCTTTDAVLQYPEDFTSFSELIAPYGQSMEDLIEGGEWIREHALPGPNLSYNNCCLASNLPESVGAVAGLGISVNVAEGDDRYSVYAERDEAGKIIRILLDFTALDDD